jgi:hypothetical protein
MNPSPDNPQKTGHLQNLARWFILVPVILLILFGCGQLALASVQPPAIEGPLTKMQADYLVWDFTEFQPVTAGILDEIRKDRSRYAYGAPPAIVLVPGVVWPTQQAAQQEATPLPPAPTEQIFSTPPATPVTQPTVTEAVLPSATQWRYIPPTATNPLPPENTKTPAATSTAAPTLTFTLTHTPAPTLTFTLTHTLAPTLTFTPTFIPTETVTLTATTAPPNHVNIGPPDGHIENIPAGAQIIIDLVALTGSPLDTSIPDSYDDLVFYEYEISTGIIMLDHVVLQVGPGPSGSCGSSTWTTVFDWGDGNASNNGQLGGLYPGEIDNQSIPFANLYLGSTTGIAIDTDALAAPGIYPCLRVYSPATGNGDAAQVDAIEILP